MNIPKRHHWVPKVYLKHFATAETTNTSYPHAWLYDLDYKASIRASLDEIAVKRSLYMVEREGVKDYSIETSYLQRIEADIDPTLNLLGQGQDVTTHDHHRHAMALFLSTLWMRNRRTVRVHEELRAHLVASARRESEDGPVSTALDDKTFTWSLQRWEEFIALGQDGMRQLFARSIECLGPRIAEELLKKHWRLLKAADGAYFVTSDVGVSGFLCDWGHTLLLKESVWPSKRRCWTSC